MILIIILSYEIRIGDNLICTNDNNWLGRSALCVLRFPIAGISCCQNANLFRHRLHQISCSMKLICFLVIPPDPTKPLCTLLRRFENSGFSW